MRVTREKDPRKVAAGKKGAAARAAKARERVLAELEAEKLKIRDACPAGAASPTLPTPKVEASPKVEAKAEPKARDYTPIAIAGAIVVAAVLLALRPRRPATVTPADVLPTPRVPTPRVPLAAPTPTSIKERDPFEM